MNSPNLLCCLALCGSTVFGAPRQATITAFPPLGELQSMALEDQREVIRAVFEHRSEHARNISYSSVLEITNHRLDGENIGEVISEAMRLYHKHWRLGESYRMASDIYVTVDGQDVAQFSQAGFNATDGVARMLVRTDGSTLTDGKIDTEQSMFIDINRYAYWLDGDDPEHGDAEFLIRYTLAHLDEGTLSFPQGEDLVQLTVPWKPLFSRTKSLGFRHLWLDPEKAYLPVRGEARWDQEDGPDWRTEEFVVEESRLVANVWMPTRLKEFIRVGHVELNPETKHLRNVVAIWDTEVLEIEHGTVTPDDLEVVFPPGTEVVDAIDGVSYVVGKDGKPDGDIMPVLVGTTLTRHAPEAIGVGGGSNRSWVITVNVALLFVAVLWYFLRRRRTAP